MAAKTTISDFQFSAAGYGQCNVTFTSPKTGKQWKKHVTDMSLIDSTKGADFPTQKALNDLKRVCKREW